MSIDEDDDSLLAMARLIGAEWHAVYCNTFGWKSQFKFHADGEWAYISMIPMTKEQAIAEGWMAIKRDLLNQINKENENEFWREM